MKFNAYIKDEKIIKAINTIGYKELTDIQEKVIPVMLEKNDCVVESKTGSGKTAAFTLPILEDLIVDQKEPQALILAPTRELALQIKETFDQLGTYKKVKSLAIFGKQPFKYQKEDLAQRCHVVIGTVGRILDHLEQGTLNVDKIRYLVLDEADEMLNMNFLEDIKKIVSYLKNPKTTCMFSATMPESMNKLVDDILNEPIWINNESTDKLNIEEYFYQVKKEDKILALCHVLEKEKPQSCMIFSNTREEVDFIEKYLSDLNISIDKIHGGMMQEERLSHMKKFKQGKFRILVSTDVAARGIDVYKVDLIINYNVPNTFEIYTHRIGRTARMNENGKCVTLVCDEEKVKYEEILDRKLDVLELKESYDVSDLGEIDRNIKDVSKDLRKDITKLYINGGKNKRLRAGDFAGAISSIDGVTFEDIGVIQVQDHQSYVDILNGKGNIVLKALKNMTIKSKKLKVEKARN